MRNLHLLACLVLSGFAGLAYELLWVRLLALGFGSTTLSFSTVLAVFFGGLALGAALGGRQAAQLRRPVRAYALLELGTGALALLLYPLIANVGTVFAWLDPGPGLFGAVVRAAVAAPLLLGPTVLMGATLPAVARAVVVDDDAVGTGSALIYGFNTIGAFLGAYLVTYALLPALGVFGATLATVGANLAAAAGAWLLEDRVARREPPPPAEEDASVPDKVRWVATALAFAVGFSAICFQVAWVRLFSIFLDGTVYAVGSVLIAVLVGIGVGSLLIARPLRSSRAPAAWLAALQLIVLVSLSALSVAMPWIAYVLRSIPAESPGLVGLHLQLLVVLIALLIPTSASGASFPLLMAIVERRAAGASRSLGGLYAANTVGSIAGSIAGGFLLLPYAGSVATVFVGLLLTALVGALASGLLADREPALPRATLALAPLLVVAVWDGFDVRELSLGGRGTARGRSYAEFRQTLRKRQQTVRFFAEGKGATVVVREQRGTRFLALNGLGQGGRRSLPPHPVYESLMVAAVPLAHRPAPPRALVVGLGAGVTVDAIVALGAKAVDVVELEAPVVEALGHIFPAGTSPLDKPEVRLLIDDARHHLAKHRARGEPPYDVITSMPAHPWVASSIFTREFFALARENLSEGGVFSTWFGLGRMDAVALHGLVRAFTSVFDSYVIYHLQEAGALYLVGGRSPLSVDVDRFTALRRHPLLRDTRKIESDLHLAMQVVATGQPGDPPAVPGPVNTDDSALVEIRGPRTATAARGLDGVLPREALAPTALAPKSRRPELAVAIIEAQLGTPEGRPAVRRTRPQARRARKTLESLGEILDPSARAYLEGRLQLVEGRAEAARAALSTVEGALAPRAALFRALSLPAREERVAALEKLPSSGTTWMARLRDDPAGVKSSLPEAPPRFEDDRWGWLVWHGLTDSSTVGAAERAQLASLGEALARSSRLEIVTLAHDLAERAGWRTEQALLATSIASARSARAQTELRRGRAAGGRGDFAAAKEALARALDLGAPPETWRLYLVALIETGASEAELDAARVRMRFAGYRNPAIEALIAGARAGRQR